ncbi:hypothetical protein DJ018_09500 [Phenylobacterium deserti]|uniref:Uncharacterized protein n=1 Tax=Phenylobacterium deserti TaxID=1914756 RepID=A0A328AT46_9CAUL|nr:hypothetical protein DJ018_09500 [Phenylobacterium deserti]
MHARVGDSSTGGVISGVTTHVHPTLSLQLRLRRPAIELALSHLMSTEDLDLSCRSAVREEA